MAEPKESACPCDDLVIDFEPRIVPGLDALPRQTRTFSTVRDALLAAVRSPGREDLAGWTARGERDLGVMWLEMWAYIADVLNFYDERIANESYVRTALRRPSLRRLIELLGYIQAPGVAGSVALGAIADGKVPVNLPAGLAFRSDAFEDQAPQVFELESDHVVEPQKNEWKIGPLDNNLLPQETPSESADPIGTNVSPASPASVRRYFSFEPSGFGVSPGAILSFRDRIFRGSAFLESVTPYEGRDGRAYLEGHLSRGISFLEGTNPKSVRVETPTNSVNATLVAGSSRLFLRLSTLVPTLQRGKRVAVTSSAEDTLLDSFVVSEVRVVQVALIPGGPNVTVTMLGLPFGTNYTQAEDSFQVHFDWARAGRMTTVRSVVVSASDMTGGKRVPVEGVLSVPQSGSRINGEFLLQGALEEGAHVRGELRIDAARRGSFGVERNLSTDPIPDMETKVSVLGNVVLASRGETVRDEVLGSGDPRLFGQSFQLRKKPLTYLPVPGTLEGIKSTLTVRVDGVLWREVKTFYGSGPQDQVYTVRQNDEQETTIRFGDGRRGARLPAGTGNVVASYRYGAGAKVPPAGAISQLARSVPGLRSVRSPVAAIPGRDPDGIETLRKSAPEKLRLIGRAVSVVDFAAAAERIIGVERASAEFRWLPERQVAGVAVTYIGDVTEDNVLAALQPLADPALPLFALRAKPLARTLRLDVVVLSRFEKEELRARIVRVLTEDYGVLSVQKANVGGAFWVSPLYEAVQSVAGVVAVQRAALVAGTSVMDLSWRDSVCVQAGEYFAFGAGAVEVTLSDAPAEEDLEESKREGI